LPREFITIPTTFILFIGVTEEVRLMRCMCGMNF